MEYKGGPRDRDPYDPYDGDRGDGSYGRQDYGQSPYTRSPYERSPYNGGSYGDYGSERGGAYGRDGGYDRGGTTGRNDRGEYDRGGTTGRNDRGEYDRGEYGRGYGGERSEYDRDDAYVPRERGGYDRADAYDRDERGGYDRADAYGRDERGGYDRADAYGRDERGYDRADAYGRDERGYDRDDRGGYDRGEDISATGRRRALRDSYADDSPIETGVYDDDEEVEARAPKKKKKRSKFSRVMRGLGAYIAELPTQTLVLFGGIVAVVLVGIVLLVVLLPKTPKSAEPEDSGQLSIADITPTPSLAPTIAPPETTPEPEATPIVDPFNGSYIKTVGEENDVIPAVQERLVELGYMEMPADGYTKRYGTATKNGIRIFQVKNYEDSDDWDGILGLGTYTLLMSEEARPFYLARGDGDSRTSDLTQLVNAVKRLQARLIELGYLGPGSDTGVFGSGTATAVKTFQKYHGLLSDGWAGQSTLALLYSPQAMTEAVGKANPITPTPAGAVDPNAAATTTDPNAAATTADPNAAAATTADPNAAAITDPNAGTDTGNIVES